MAKKQQRQKENLSFAEHVLVNLQLPANPSLVTGFAGLWQGMLGIMSVRPPSIPHVTFRSNDYEALVGDMRHIIMDGHRAHAELLRLHPELIH